MSAAKGQDGMRQPKPKGEIQSNSQASRDSETLPFFQSNNSLPRPAQVLSKESSARDADFSYREIPKEKIPCPICSGMEFSVLGCKDRYSMGICTVICKECGLIMTNPVPTGAALEQFYRCHYRRLYRKPEIPSEQYIATLGLNRRASYTVDFLKAQNLLPDRGAVLDIGCSEGSILKEIKTRSSNLSMVGIEPAEATAEFARKYSGGGVYGDLKTVKNLYSQGFQLIILNHVLEHAQNPVTFLRDLQDLMAMKGLIYNDVPDASVYSSLNDFHIAHLYHFSPRTIKLVARRAGFGVVYIERHTPPRHPPSLRCVLSTKPSKSIVSGAGEQEDEGDIFERIRSLLG